MGQNVNRGLIERAAEFTNEAGLADAGLPGDDANMARARPAFFPQLRQYAGPAGSADHARERRASRPVEPAFARRNRVDAPGLDRVVHALQPTSAERYA